MIENEYKEFIEQEYQELVTALARKHLRMERLVSGRLAEGEPYERPIERIPLAELDNAVEHLMSTALLLRAVRERAEAGGSFSVRENETDAYEMLGHEVKLTEHSARKVTEHLNNFGILEALDDVARTSTIRDMPRTAIPDEDLEILRRCGVEDPEAEITILRRSLRDVYTQQGTYEYLKECAKRLEDVGNQMEQPPLSPPVAPSNEPRILNAPRKRKILNGVGNLLVGFATAGGNALLGVGTIAAPNPATGYLVISSSALALGALFKGLGDLSGE